MILFMSNAIPKVLGLDNLNPCRTMGPKKASIKIREEYPNAASYRVTLYGSLAATGKGHLTDMAIKEVFDGVAPVEIVWCAQQYLPYY